MKTNLHFSRRDLLKAGVAFGAALSSPHIGISRGANP
jgi:hypothetical protein